MHAILPRIHRSNNNKIFVIYSVIFILTLYTFLNAPTLGSVPINMLQKFLRVHKLSAFCTHPNSSPTSPVASQRSAQQDASLALKIVRPGGITECYYMPVQAFRILEKYPTYVLAKPEVFTQPWNSVVRPEKILFPGRRFFLVPRHTIRKLRRRNKRPDKSQCVSINKHRLTNNNDDEGVPSNNEVSLQSDDDISVSSEVSSSFSCSFRKKPAGVEKHVRFAGIDVHYKAGASSTLDKKAKVEEKPRKSSSSRSKSGKREGRKNAYVPWQPSLTSISEIQGDL